MFAALVPSSPFLVFNASTSGPVSRTDTLTITNTGATALSFAGGAFAIVRDPADASDESARFAITNSGSLPSSLAPGQSAQVLVDYSANVINTVQSALLQITSSDPVNPVIDVQLHGLGTNGQFGTNEPSLANILTANDIPTNIGVTDPSNSQYPVTPNSSSQEVTMPRLVKAGSGPVTITPLASFDASTAPTLKLGYYTPGDVGDTKELFTIAQADAQTVNPTALGATAFDPASASFGLYAVFPGTSIHYSEDAFNTLATNSPHKFRFFPLENADHSIVPNAYVFAAEDYNTSAFNSFTNFVGIIRNVKPAADAINAPVIGLENLDGVPAPDRLVFSRIQFGTPPSYDPSFVDQVHDTATVRIHNTGDQPLVIHSLTLSDTTNWLFVNPPAAGTTVAANGGTLDVTIKFYASSVPLGNSYNQTNDTATVNQNGLPPVFAGAVWDATLTINTNDPSNSARTVQLAGYWQHESEHENEPGLQTQVNSMLGYGTDISNTYQPNYMNNGATPVYFGEELQQSGLWNAVDATQPVTVRQLGAWHNQFDPNTMTEPGATISWYAQGSSSNNAIFRQEPGSSQSMFPTINGSTTAPAQGSFTPSGTFGWNLDGENSQDSLNTTDINTFGRSGHAVRFFPARDSQGNLIPNTWLVGMDYENSTFDNSDFQDSLYLVTNMRPASQAPAPTDLQATAGSGGATLQWAPVNDGTLIGYNVYASTSPLGPFTKLNGAPTTSTTYTDAAAPAGMIVYYAVSAVDSAGESEKATAPVAIANPTPNALQSQDINAVPSGSTTVVTAGQAYDVTAGGADIGGTNADGFRYVNQLITGDFDAVVQVSSLSQHVQPDTRAGLMVRDSLDAGSTMVFSGATASDGYRFNYRGTQSEIGTFSKTGSLSYPNVWVRLVRKGDSFTGYSSADGVNWTQIGTVTISMPDTIYLGMAVASHDPLQTADAQLRNYTPASAAPLPTPAPLATPANFTATAASSGITLQWSAVTGAVGYNVLSASSASGPYTQMNTTPLAGTSYVDANAPTGVATFYEVVAVDSMGNASSPAMASATRPASGTGGGSGTTISFGGRTVASYADSAGHHVTLKLSGPGTGKANFDTGNANPGSIVLTGTTAASVLTITVQGGSTNVGTIFVNGSLNKLIGTHVNLVGDMTVTGTLGAAQLASASGGHAINIEGAGRAPSLSLGQVSDLSIDSAASIALLQAISWAGGTGGMDIIAAPAITRLMVGGNFGGSIHLSGTGLDLRNALVKGALSSGNWIIAGSIGQLNAASVASGWSAAVAGSISAMKVHGNFAGNLTASSIKTLQIGGDLTGSIIRLTGGTATDLQSLVVGGSISGSQVRATGSILTIKAAGLANSNIFAGVNQFTTALPTSAGDFTANSSIRTVVVTGQKQVFAVQGSNVAAATLGNVTFGAVNTNNSGVQFGLAAHQLASYSRRVNGKLLTWKSKQGPSQLTASGDAVARLL